MGCNFTLNSLCYHPRTPIISKTEALIVTLVIPAEEKRFAPDALLADIAKGRTTESFRQNQQSLLTVPHAIPCFTFKKEKPN
jgi:hypothetical protein